MPRFTVYVERPVGWIEARTYGEAYREAVQRFERDGQRIARVEIEVFGRGVQRVLDDYIGLYTKDRLPDWKALFLPGFTAAYTNYDGSVTTRTLAEFYERQRAAFERGPVAETLHDVRITRSGRLAHVAAGFDFTSGGTTRRGRLMLLTIETAGRFRIAALTFTYHLA